jgi:hypothetical protein
VIEQVVFVRKISDGDRRPAGVVVIAERNTHGGLLRAVVANGCSRLQANILEFSVAQIFVQIFRREIVRYIYVGMAAVIKVRPDHSKPVVAGRIADAFCFETSVKVPSPLL